MSDKVFSQDGLAKVGVYFGKLLPPHRGHLNAIINAATLCKKLYVVVSDNIITTEKICKEAGIPTITYQLRLQWLSQELVDMPHIEVVHLDETGIPEPPLGWDQWVERLQDVVGEEINTFFCGEVEYVGKLRKYFPNAKVNLFDPSRSKYHISATEIRNNPIKHWDYILGPARPFFTTKILIAGTESCGKTTLTKGLAKIYYTSWSEEVGRYYAQQYLGGNESIFTDEDFGRIANLQLEQDYKALRTANKICFFDTDAVITQYYSDLYMGHQNKIVEACINPDKFDVVFLLTPDVEWIDDGQRLNGEQSQREVLHNKLKSMYINRGFENKIVEVSGDYNTRLNFINDYIQNNLL